MLTMGKRMADWIAMANVTADATLSLNSAQVSSHLQISQSSQTSMDCMSVRTFEINAESMTVRMLNAQLQGCCSSRAPYKNNGESCNLVGRIAPLAVGAASLCKMLSKEAAQLLSCAWETVDTQF